MGFKALRKDQYYERIKLLRIPRCFFFITFSQFAQKNQAPAAAGA
jgi:hypothetical protein